MPSDFTSDAADAVLAFNRIGAIRVSAQQDQQRFFWFPQIFQEHSQPPSRLVY